MTLVSGVKKYKLLIESNCFNPPSVKFELDIKKINFLVLRTPEVHDLNPSDFEVISLNLEKVVQSIRKDYDSLYSKTELFVMKEFSQTAELLDMIFAEKKLIPPIISRVGKTNKIAVYDGNHRIGLFRYLNYSTIPFLIRNGSQNLYAAYL